MNAREIMYLFLMPVLIQGCGMSSTGRPVADVQKTLAAAISCTPNGLTREDSALYMQQGGADFQPTLVNRVSELMGATPEGMARIPGGMFSMGGINASGMKDGGHESMDDARPVHRVYVD